MKPEIKEESQSPETMQSFVIRMWQEERGEWRGSIRHVQSDARKGFKDLDQAIRFVRRQTRVQSHVPFTQQIGSLARPTWSLSQRSRRMLVLATGLALVAVLALLLLSQYALGPVIGFAH